MFRPKAMRQDREENCIDNNMMIKNTVTAPKNIRKKSRLGEYMN